MDRKIYNENSRALLELAKTKGLSLPLPLSPDTFSEAIRLAKIFIVACYDPRQYFQYTVVAGALWDFFRENKECRYGYGWIDLSLYPNFFENIKLEPAENAPNFMVEMLRTTEPPFVLIFVDGKVNLVLPCGLLMLACKQCVYKKISITVDEVEREVNSK